jgi:hypothetical protein
LIGPHAIAKKSESVQDQHTMQFLLKEVANFACQLDNIHRFRRKYTGIQSIQFNIIDTVYRNKSLDLTVCRSNLLFELPYESIPKITQNPFWIDLAGQEVIYWTTIFAFTDWYEWILTRQNQSWNQNNSGGVGIRTKEK